VGFIACAIAGVFFGSNFVPVKKYEVGDGVFFQWVMCVGIWCVGLVTTGFTSNEFQPLSMLGGALWCTGNIMCLQVMKLIGMSMGLMIWGITNSVMGWATGKFGLFGLDKNSVSDPALNYVGLSLTIVSLAVFSQVQTSVKSAEDNNLTEPMILKSSSDNIERAKSEKDADWTSYVDKRFHHGLGFVGACVCGIFFGLNFTPPLYQKAHGGPQSETDYVFSHFCGIFATSTFFMIVYSILKKK